jgi:hypothetical protein
MQQLAIAEHNQQTVLMRSTTYYQILSRVQDPTIIQQTATIQTTTLQTTTTGRTRINNTNKDRRLWAAQGAAKHGIIFSTKHGRIATIMQGKNQTMFITTVAAGYPDNNNAFFGMVCNDLRARQNC